MVLGDEEAGRVEAAGRGEALGRDRAPGRGAAAGPVDRRAERGGVLLRGGGEPAAAPRRVRVGHEHERGAERLGADRALAEPPREPRRDRVQERLAGSPSAGGRGERGQAAARQGPRRREGRRADRLLTGGRVLGQQPDEPAPAPLALARGRGLLLGTPRPTPPRARRCRRRSPRPARRSPAASPPATPASTNRRQASRAPTRYAASSARGCGRSGTRRGRGRRRCAGDSVASGSGSASRSTKRLNATSTPRRTTWPNSPSIARA